jgi:hypothetical protein
VPFVDGVREMALAGLAGGFASRLIGGRAANPVPRAAALVVQRRAGAAPAGPRESPGALR